MHTPESLGFWYRQEAAERRPVIADLCAQGILLTDDGVGEQWQSRAREHMAQGPKPLDNHERDLRRYDLSSLIDDVEGSRHDAETYALASDLFRDTADLLLLQNGSWLGGGKWKIRRLLLDGSDLAVRLCTWALEPARETASLVLLAREVLELSGGYVQEGFLRGERQQQPAPGAETGTQGTTLS